MAIINPPRTMLEVFESLSEGTLCQLINNQLIMSPAPSDIHQKVLLDIAVEIREFLKKKNSGDVRIAPYDGYLRRRNVFQPDIVFISKENVYRYMRMVFMAEAETVKGIITSVVLNATIHF